MLISLLVRGKKREDERARERERGKRKKEKKEKYTRDIRSRVSNVSEL